MEIFKLFGSVFIDNTKADQALDTTEKKGGSLANTLGIVTKGAAVVGGALLAAGGGMLALATKTAATADEIDKLSERTGINREELQRWKYAAGQSGADVNKLEVGVKKLSDVMNGALTGNKANAQAFSQLGISLTDANGKARDTESVFTEVMSTLGDMEQGAARNALGNDLLGKSYTEMLPLLNAGSAGMNDLKTRADELGLVMSEDSVKAGVLFGDTMDDVKLVFEAVVNKIGIAFLPILQKLLDWAIANMPAIEAAFKTAFNAIDKAIGLVSGSIEGLNKFYTENKDLIDSLAIGLAAAGVAFGLYTIAVNASAIATGLWTIVTTAATVAGTAFGVAMAVLTSPITLVIAAIALLVAGGVLLYKNWDEIMAKVTPIWEGIKGSISTAVGKLTEIFGTFKTFVTDTWNGIVGGIKGSINAILKAINGMVTRMNTLKFDIPEWVPIIGGNSWGFNLPPIPLLAKGGNITQSGYAMVGEAGPEILELPRGARVTPLGAGGSTIGEINIYGNNADEIWDKLERKMAMLGVVL